MSYHHININQLTNIEELGEIYNVADVFVNPTLEDNLPTVNLELAVFDTPVITYKTGESPGDSYSPDCFVNKGNYEAILHLLKGRAYESALELEDSQQKSDGGMICATL